MANISIITHVCTCTKSKQNTAREAQRGGCTQFIIIRARLHSRFTILICHAAQMGHMALAQIDIQNQIEITSRICKLNQAAVPPPLGQSTLHHPPGVMLLEPSISIESDIINQAQAPDWISGPQPSRQSTIYLNTDRTSPEMMLSLHAQKYPTQLKGPEIQSRCHCHTSKSTDIHWHTARSANDNLI